MTHNVHCESVWVGALLFSIEETFLLSHFPSLFALVYFRSKIRRYLVNTIWGAISPRSCIVSHLRWRLISSRPRRARGGGGGGAGRGDRKMRIDTLTLTEAVPYSSWLHTVRSINRRGVFSSTLPFRFQYKNTRAVWKKQCITKCRFYFALWQRGRLDKECVRVRCQYVPWAVYGECELAMHAGGGR